MGKQSDDEPCAVQRREGGAECTENSCAALLFVEVDWVDAGDVRFGEA